MLTRVVERVRRAEAVDDVIVATTTSTNDDVTVERARALDVGVFRGDEHDVLDPFERAASAAAADLVVRVTADRPLIEPEIINRVVVAMQTLNPRVAFGANTILRTFPRGLDVRGDVGRRI